MSLRKIVPAASIALLLGLTGCSANTVNAETGAEPFVCSNGGSAVSLLNAESDLTESPSLDFPFPLKSPNTEMKYVQKGDGQQVQENQTIRTRLSLYSGRSGELLYDGNHTDIEKSPLYLLVNEGTLKGSQFESILEPILCSTFGSRIAVTTPASNVFDPDMLTMYQLQETDAIIFLIDVVDGFLAKADGADQIVNNNSLPSASFAPDGTPGLTFRNNDAPTELTVELLKDGKHETVEENDEVILHFSSWDWNDRRVTDTTWTNKTPSQLRLGTNANPLLPDDALIGQNVGSQLMVVTPDAENGATIVIVDILGIQKSNE